jgi:glycosyltransferase involved in cell wall biosynthesis
MGPTLAPITPMVLLIGNYSLDRQHSMQRFGTMMLSGLTNAGVNAELIVPEPLLGKFRDGRGFIAKWLAYIDKYLLFPNRLRAKLKEAPDVVHVCDHSNAVYTGHLDGIPTVVTCHDLIAVRDALGEQTDCPMSSTGKLLQRWILRGLRRASVIVCVSNATRADVVRIVGPNSNRREIEVVSLGLNYPYKRLERSEALARLGKIPELTSGDSFVLNVSSNFPRKNRPGVLRIFARCKGRWNGRLVFVGEPLNPELTSLASSLGIADRITQIENAESEILEALYNCAVALVYPSTFEGFGWPIIEAHACGCPVICSNSGPMPEAAGEAGLFHDVHDEEGFAADLLRLTDSAERATWSEKGVRNAARFSADKMVGHYIDIYRRLGAKI